MKVNHTYTIDKSVLTHKTTQVSQLITTIARINGDTITDEQIEKALHCKDSLLKTRQDPFLIFQYYRPALRECGFITGGFVKRARTTSPALYASDDAHWETAGGDYTTME